ncbi:ATP-dependent DNA ligase [Candidatus Dependentiae bacterium]|nr:ATP-dependent DNA ligase [Candidatus Dependentiae bacterium]MCC7415044.1 ATP-dependent DNA ligase [Campylobacterota bacterium]
MNFSVVSDYFQQIESTPGRLDMTRLLAQLLSQASANEADIICNLALGQLHPPFIGTQFTLAETLMTHIVADIAQQNVDTVTQQAKKLGDLGLVIEQYADRTTQELTVAQVYGNLCALEEISGSGSHEEKRNKTVALLRQVDPVSAKFIVRIIIGKLRLGFSDMTIIDALSWMICGNKSLHETIESAYNLCADIGYTARLLKESGIDAIQHVAIRIGSPIRPAGAERLPSAQAIIDKMGRCVAQPKIDGFRLQIHYDATGPTPKIHFFSRHLTDMSAMFPDLVQEIVKLGKQSFIAEGETIAYDPNTQSFLPFQETMKRRRKHDIEAKAAEFPLQIIFFDLLYLNGQDLLSTGHEQRRALLLDLVGDRSSAMRVIEEKPIENVQALESYFLSCIAAGLEGLVVKRPHAPYQAGKRNFNWIKLKRHEMGQLEDSIDAVVLGYYAGSGKRAAFGIGAFLVGVYNKHDDSFQTLAKVGTGLKDADWIELRRRCDSLAVQQQPKNVACAPQLYPDVWVAPELVVSILAEEITQSPTHKAGSTDTTLGYALRFPRFVDYRPDKGPGEATTSDEIVRLYEDQFVK